MLIGCCCTFCDGQLSYRIAVRVILTDFGVEAVHVAFLPTNRTASRELLAAILVALALQNAVAAGFVNIEELGPPAQSLSARTYSAHLLGEDVSQLSPPQGTAPTFLPSPLEYAHSLFEYFLVKLVCEPEPVKE